MFMLQHQQEIAVNQKHLCHCCASKKNVLLLIILGLLLARQTEQRNIKQETLHVLSFILATLEQHIQSLTPFYVVNTVFMIH